MCNLDLIFLFLFDVTLWSNFPFSAGFCRYTFAFKCEIGVKIVGEPRAVLWLTSIKYKIPTDLQFTSYHRGYIKILEIIRTTGKSANNVLYGLSLWATIRDTCQCERELRIKSTRLIWYRGYATRKGCYKNDDACARSVEMREITRTIWT